MKNKRRMVLYAIPLNRPYVVKKEFAERFKNSKTSEEDIKKRKEFDNKIKNNLVNEYKPKIHNYSFNVFGAAQKLKHYILQNPQKHLDCDYKIKLDEYYLTKEEYIEESLKRPLNLVKRKK